MTALHFGFSCEREIGEGREGGRKEGRWEVGGGDNESHRPSLSAAR